MRRKAWLGCAVILAFCVEPLLAEPWIRDVEHDELKLLYGHQEGAVLGYNPKKPGRPSHCSHAYSIASTCLVLDCRRLRWRRAYVQARRAEPVGAH